MKQIYFKIAKKTVLTFFLGIGLLFGTQGIYAIGTFTTTATGGNWSDASTWVDGIVPPAVTNSSDIIIINGDVTLTLNAANTVLTTTNTPNRYTFTVGSITIAVGKTLNVTSLNGSALIPYFFTIGSLTVPSTLNGNLNFDASIFGGKTIANLTVSLTGSFIESKTVSISTSANTTLTNYGTVTTATLAPNATAKIDNYGTLNYTGFSSSTTAITTNYAGGIFINTSASGGTIAGDFRNYGTYTAAGLTGTSTTAKFTNYSTGVLNFNGGSMTATNLVLTATEAGNTVVYGSANSQTIKDVVYSNLTIDNAGDKTIPTAASGTLCTGTFTILGTAPTPSLRASIANTNVKVNALVYGGATKATGTYGGLSSAATTKFATNFTGSGYLLIDPTLGVAKFTENDMRLYPNPSKGGKFTISLPATHDEANVSIINLDGKTIYTAKIAADEEARVNPNSVLAAGVYFVKVEQAGNAVTKKLIVN